MDLETADFGLRRISYIDGVSEDDDLSSSKSAATMGKRMAGGDIAYGELEICCGH